MRAQPEPPARTEGSGQGAPRGREQHLRSLTGMRFYAAMLVVLTHVVAGIAPVPFVQDLTTMGRVGVSFFFVLSGFVLSWTDGRDPQRPRFYRNRFARIYPLHLLTWFAAGAIALALGQSVGPLPAILTLLLLQAWVPIQSVYFGMNGPSWSLSCEAFFYALFPSISPRVWRSSTRAVVRLMIAALLAAAAVSVVGHLLLRGPFSVGIFYVNPAYRIWEFVVGIGLAVLVRRGWRPPVPLRAAVAITVLAYLAVAALNAGITHRIGPLGGLPLGALPDDLSSLLLTPCFALLIAVAAAAELSGARTGLAGRMIVRLGRWSYALYLSHLLIVTLVAAALPASLGLAPRAVVGVGTIALAVGVSGLLYRFVETRAELRLRAPRSPIPVDLPEHGR